MSLFDLLMTQGGAAAAQLGKRFGLDQEQVTSAVQQLLPALGAGLQNNVKSPGGLADLFGALSTGNHSKYLENPDLVNHEETTETGNRILGHLLGNKEVSRDVTTRASGSTGISAEVLKQMLPVVATMLMGSLSRQSSEAGLFGDEKSSGQPHGLMDLLTPFLASEQGGTTGTPLDMIGRYLRNR